MTTKRTPKGHLTPDYIAAYMKKTGVARYPAKAKSQHQ